MQIKDLEKQMLVEVDGDTLRGADLRLADLRRADLMDATEDPRGNLRSDV